jgi:hypothetical protein
LCSQRGLKQLEGLLELLLGSRHGFLLRIGAGRVLEAKHIVGRAIERDLEYSPIEADLQVCCAMLMRRLLPGRCRVGR